MKAPLTAPITPPYPPATAASQPLASRYEQRAKPFARSGERRRAGPNGPARRSTGFARATYVRIYDPYVRTYRRYVRIYDTYADPKGLLALRSNASQRGGVDTKYPRLPEGEASPPSNFFVLLAHKIEMILCCLTKKLPFGLRPPLAATSMGRRGSLLRAVGKVSRPHTCGRSPPAGVACLPFAVKNIFRQGRRRRPANKKIFLRRQMGSFNWTSSNQN